MNLGPDSYIAVEKASVPQPRPRNYQRDRVERGAAEGRSGRPNVDISRLR